MSALRPAGGQLPARSKPYLSSSFDLYRFFRTRRLEGPRHRGALDCMWADKRKDCRMVANQKKYTDGIRRETADYVISTGCP